MNKSWLVGSFFVLALGFLVTDGFGGPRGGGRAGAGGSRGGNLSRPTGGSFSGGNLQGRTVSPPTGNTIGGNFRGSTYPTTAGSGLNGFSSRDLGTGGLQGSDKLSSLLNGTTPAARTGQAPSLNQLQNHLNLRPQGVTPTAENRGEFRGDYRGEAEANRDQRQNARQEGNRQFSERSGQIYNNMTNHLQDRPEPFTAAWYADHPQAWQQAHPHADAWAAASWGAVTGWFAGVATTPVTYGYGNTYVYLEGTDEPTEEAAQADSQAQAQQAHQLSQSTQPTADDASWLPLGVYALVQGDETKAQIMMQLSLSQSGQLAGSYYHVLTGKSEPLQGSVDRETQKVAWTIAGNDHVVFQTDLNSLTHPETPVLVHYSDGETHQMTLVRMPDEK